MSMHPRAYFLGQVRGPTNKFPIGLNNDWEKANALTNNTIEGVTEFEEA